MILPTIHLNGTGRETLRATYDAAAERLQDFVDAWGRVEFNARDYYVQGNEAFPAAQDERQAMALKIRELTAYLQAIREHLYD